MKEKKPMPATRPWMVPLVLLSALTVLLLSLPFLFPGSGIAALFALVPLLAMERLATQWKIRRFWLWHFGTFVLWNAVTTWWVCEATFGGGVFAILANALQMSLVFGLFRAFKKRIGGGGVLPYIFLAALWIAWERFYLTAAEISWPWLVLGNAFAGDISLVQWYCVTGTLGGSLWIWAVNLSIFGLLVAYTGGAWQRWNGKARVASVLAPALLLVVPVAVSLGMWYSDEPEGDGRTLPVLIVQPNIDPYDKYKMSSQNTYDENLVEAVESSLEEQPVAKDEVLLVVAPETFTFAVPTDDVSSHLTQQHLVALAARHPELRMNILYGASTYDRIDSERAPSRTAQKLGGKYWKERHNSALMTDSSGRVDIYHKTKLVVGTESTPYPAIFVPIDDWLGGVMARDIGQEHRTALPVCSGRPGEEPVRVGCAICYESVYGEFCTEYVRDAGADVLAVITNDGWWGDSPGHRQHLRYSSLRAIETRRAVIRCGNTGISALIDRKGRVLASTSWWQPAVLRGEVSLSSEQTFFVRHGDIPGRIAVFVALLLAAFALVRVFTGRKESRV